jgi:GNAT superfamily N-acetyltransferase
MRQDERLTIRRAALEDAEALRELAARIYHETFESVNTPENMQAYISTAFALSQLQSELIEPAATFFLAEVDMKPVGYAKLMASDAPACVQGDAPVELVRFYIDRSWQGTGLAGALMEHCLREAKRQGFATMYLGVWEHNTRAQAFYRKWDFVRVGEHIFQMGDDPQVDWWMVRSI